MSRSMEWTSEFKNLSQSTKNGLVTNLKPLVFVMRLDYQLAEEILCGLRAGYPCGEWPDVKIAKVFYLHYAGSEVTLADKGYQNKTRDP